MTARVVKFIERYCVYPDGPNVGKPVQLLPWQRELLEELFARHPDGRRKHRFALIGIPKKNGKTTLAAWMALYLLLADQEPTPEVLCAAATEAQADLVFRAARMTCQLSPYLRPLVEIYANEILVKGKPSARLRRVPASVGAIEGANPSAVIIDELHEWIGLRRRQVWHVLTNSFAARRDPLVIQITTAGWDRDSLCYEQYRYGLAVQRGEITDPTFFFRWWSAPYDLDWRSEEAWEKANPSYGVIVQPDFLADQVRKKPEAIFRRYFLNQWWSQEYSWLTDEQWQQCADPTLELQPGQPTWIGLDTSARNDATALVAAQWVADRIVVRAWIWERPLLPDGSPDPDWLVPEAELEQRLLELAGEYDVQIVRSDWAHMHLLRERLRAQGLPIEYVPHSIDRLVELTELASELIRSRVVAHDGNPVLARHVRNAVVRASSGTGKMAGRPHLSKGYGLGPNDGAIALVLALQAAVLRLSLAPAAKQPAAPRLWLPEGIETENVENVAHTRP